jgi:hypothetical protein
LVRTSAARERISAAVGAEWRSCRWSSARSMTARWLLGETLALGRHGQSPRPQSETGFETKPLARVSLAMYH